MNGTVNKALHCNVALFLLEIGSFTNIMICIDVLKMQTIKLAHTLKIDCFLTCKSVLFSFEGKSKN